MVTTVCLRFSTEDLWVRRSSAINANDHRYLSIQWIRWLQQKQKKKRTNMPRFSIESSGPASERRRRIHMRVPVDSCPP